MKAITIALLLLGVLAAPAWAGQGSKVYELGVDGLACPYCAYGIEKSLTAMEGFQKLDIDMDKGIVTVTLAGDAPFDEATAKEIVADAGFTLRRFERGETRGETTE